MKNTLVKEYNDPSKRSPEKDVARFVLEEIVKEGARQMLQAAIENEAAEDLDRYRDLTDDERRRLAVLNRYLPERKILTGVGPLSVRQPRVDDRKLRQQKEGEPFPSSILPRYLRRVPSIDNLIPALYQKGISTGDFSQALSAITGPAVKGLSATNIVRIKAQWEADCRHWGQHDLSDKEYVYVWADGIYFNVRLDDERM